MNGAVLFGLVLTVFGCLMFAVGRVASTLSANIRVQLGQKLEKAAFIRRNVRIARIMGVIVVLVGFAMAVFGLTVGRAS